VKHSKHALANCVNAELKFRCRGAASGPTEEAILTVVSAVEAQAGHRPAGQTILTTEGLSQRFGGVAAVSDVSLRLAEGEVLGLIGPNGAGKTTLFDAIAGVRRPTAGRILLEGREITRSSAVARARLGIRRTFQRQQLFGWLSVEDNVLTAMEWRGGGGGMAADVLGLPSRRRRAAARRERAAAVLAQTGLVDVRRRPAGELSIGQARMLEFARAIVDPPRVLLLDEPTSGLSSEEVHAMMSALTTVRSETSCAVLLVEHDVPYVMKHCDRIIVMNLGRVFAEGSPEEIAAHPDVRAVYLD
jgi:branched-chain amino acid transport system ATP-binding protein